MSESSSWPNKNERNKQEQKEMAGWTDKKQKKLQEAERTSC